MKRSIRPILCATIILSLSWYSTLSFAHPAAGAADYAKATKLLTQGENFNQAITLLQSAVRSNPKNADYHLALGCAYADRAVSVAYARSWQWQYGQDKANYSKDLADWQADQKKEPNPWPAPTKPPATFQAYTKDDGKPLALSNAQALAIGTDLIKAAQAQWQLGVSITGKGKEHASAEFLVGWGNMLLAKLQGWTPNDYGKPYDNEKAYEASAQANFQAAIHDDPKNVVYWESLGYASDGKQSIAAYLEALALRPTNPTIWYVVFDKRFSEARESVSQDNLRQAIKATPSGLEAIAALKKAIAQNPENAGPIYEMAYLVLWSTHYDNNGMNDAGPPDQKDQVNAVMEKSLTAEDKKDAVEVLALMDKAGRCSQCFTPRGKTPVPDLLVAAWKYAALDSDLASSSFGEMRALARDMYGVAIAYGIEDNLQGAVQAEQDTIRMGYQLAGTWPVKNSTLMSQEVMGPLVGRAVISIGYEGLIKVEQKYGTPQQVKKTQVEYDAFKARMVKYRALFKKSEPASIYAQY